MIENKVMERVVQVRNTVAHSTGGFEKSDFTRIWEELEGCLKELGKDAGLFKDTK